ncbi:MAP3K12-binding inhibitory protein 1 isoform X1 [Entelurus aequoreus]|uniref:MAP3K12-binding inhibitory protein 1 isoform X1 n=1 Tax=Entelurus aequoreus TaxID=161455 RepID=UPI002B1D5C87|nr:MAP3K12-binding inhibitory protein 1 isoform X1 [Entelurus aequoreus]XP_061896962.1 MAP3K12-binding inhibitory protein 1 isoform X1 [Entelurus aequoreus]
MATTARKPSGSRSTVGESSKKMSSASDCLGVLLELLVDFGRELNLGDAALRVDVNVDAASLQSSDAAHVYSCLQQHITNLQTVSESLRTLTKAHSHTLLATKKETPRDAVSTSALEDPTPSERGPPLPDAAAAASDATSDVLVQIRAGKSEIERRISAFMERKQMEINENNVREFCNVIDCNQAENSCARTDAVFTPYPGFKSHVKVTRVVNTYGPQTRTGVQGEAFDQARSLATRDCGNPAVEERLNNMEFHLKLPTAGPVPLSVYQRLKKLEDRILQLEGLSPEYFQSSNLAHKRLKTSPAQACSLTELDEKINAVRAALRKKANEFRPEYGSEYPL